MIFMYQGEPLLCFQHRRIHEIPPEGGASSLCESMAPDANPELIEVSGAAAQDRLGRGRNGGVSLRPVQQSRHAHQRPLLGQPAARFAGGGAFAWLTYAVLGKGERPALAPYRVGLRCGFLVAEVKRLHRIVFEPGLIQEPRAQVQSRRQRAGLRREPGESFPQALHLSVVRSGSGACRSAVRAWPRAGPQPRGATRWKGATTRRFTALAQPLKHRPSGQLAIPPAVGLLQHAHAGPPKRRSERGRLLPSDSRVHVAKPAGSKAIPVSVQE